MGEAPDAAAALDAVAALRALIAGEHQADASDPASWARLAGQLVRIAEDAHWARDAALVHARAAGASWTQLEQATGVPDATLANRRRRFLEVNP